MPIVMPDAAMVPLEVMLEQAIWRPLSLVHLSFTFIISCDMGVLEYLLANTSYTYMR